MNEKIIVNTGYCCENLLVSNPAVLSGDIVIKQLLWIPESHYSSFCSLHNKFPLCFLWVSITFSCIIFLYIFLFFVFPLFLISSHPSSFSSCSFSFSFFLFYLFLHLLPFTFSFPPSIVSHLSYTSLFTTALPSHCVTVSWTSPFVINRFTFRSCAVWIANRAAPPMFADLSFSSFGSFSPRFSLMTGITEIFSNRRKWSDIWSKVVSCQAIFVGRNEKNGRQDVLWIRPLIVFFFHSNCTNGTRGLVQKWPKLCEAHTSSCVTYKVFNGKRKVSFKKLNVH